MEIITKTFGKLTQDAYDKSCKYLKSIGKRVSFEFDTAVIFAVASVYETGDVAHVNNLIPILKLANLEPAFRRTVVAFDLIPFNYDAGALQYTGKIKKGDRAAMEVERDGVPQWEIVLRAALDGEKPENKSKPVFNLESRMANLFKAARKEGKTDAEINEAIKAARKLHPHIKAVDSKTMDPANQKRVKDNKADHDERVKVETAKRKAG
jgi:hypothetical protein